jgi:DNA helicase II / ATP-dependent DNA helicase PcrA
MSLDGPHMVIAGAGSGKTRVLTYRLAFILSQGLAEPQELLALTFTNKAAREMKERVYQLVGPAGKSLVMGTFHSIFSRILRVEAEKIGYTRSFTIYDSDDSQRQIKQLIKNQGLDDKLFKPRVVQNHISSAKNKMVSPKEYQEHVFDDFGAKVAELYAQYEVELFKSNAMDFDDLLLKPILLFRGHPDVLHRYQHRFRYLMIDEYQDTNHAQYLLTKMLAAVHHNICVVGDDAQSIYAFRGANIQNILNFQKDYPDVQVIKLEQNYRSTQNIVNAANSVIARNKHQIPKKVFTANETGEFIHLLASETDQDEARKVVNELREQKQMLNFFNKDFAILYRTNAQSRSFEEELRRASIPSKVFGGMSFYQRKEIKDTVAYLRLAINPKDQQALERVINYPTRGIGKTSWEKIRVFAADRGIGLWDALVHITEAGLATRISNVVNDFVTLIRSFGVYAQEKNAHEAAKYIAKSSGILKDLHNPNDQEQLTRWENVQELLNAAQGYLDDPEVEDLSLEGFLSTISLFTDADEKLENDDYVSLMSIHSAKGLEFNSIFLVGMEENIFPSSMTETAADLEEERRLFYVAITRAQKRLTLTHARSRYRYGNVQFNEPSRFLFEVDPQYIRKTARETRQVSSGRGSRRPTAPPAKGNGRNLTPVSRATVRPSADPSFEPSDPAEIATGQAVLHQKFRRGKVMSIEGEGRDRKATIEFEGQGRKVLILRFAKLQILQKG